MGEPSQNLPQSACDNGQISLCRSCDVSAEVVRDDSTEAPHLGLVQDPAQTASQWCPCVDCQHLVGKVFDKRWGKRAQYQAGVVWSQLHAPCLLCMMEQETTLSKMCFDQVGCWLVQWFLDCFGLGEDWIARKFQASLHGRVVEAAQSPQANYVFQHLVKNISEPSITQWVVKEVLDSACSLARHEVGCRIIRDLVEQGAHTECMVDLIDCLLKQAHELIKHKYGHHVIQKILKHGLPSHHLKIVISLCDGMGEHAHCEYSRYVVKDVLREAHVPNEQKEATARHMLKVHRLKPIAGKLSDQVVGAAQNLVGHDCKGGAWLKAKGRTRARE